MEKRKSYPEVKITSNKNKETASEKPIGKITQDLFNSLDKDSQLFKKILNDDPRPNNISIIAESSTKNIISDKKEKKKKKVNDTNIIKIQSDGESEGEKEKKTKPGKTKKLNKSDNNIKTSQVKENKKSSSKEKNSKRKSKEKNQKKPLTEIESLDKVKQFMIEQNRPFSVQNIVDIMRGQIKKAQCQKIMDKLLEDEIVIMKEYNFKVYLANQNLFEKLDAENIEKLEKKVEKTKNKLAEQKEENLALISEYENLCEELSDEELKKRIYENKRQLQEVEQSIKEIESKKIEQLPQDKIKETEKNYEESKNRYKKTKRACGNIIDTLLDNLDITKQELLNLLSLEDESATLSLLKIKLI